METQNTTLRFTRFRNSIDCCTELNRFKEIDRERSSSESPVSNNQKSESKEKLIYGITNITITNKTTLKKHEESITRQSDNQLNEISESEIASTKSSCENEIRKNSCRSSKTSSEAKRNIPTLKKTKIERIDELCAQKLSMFESYLSNDKHWVLATPCKSTYMNIGYDEDCKAQSTSALKRKYKRGRLKFSQICIPEGFSSHKPKNPYMCARKSLRPITTSIQYYTPKLKTSQHSIKITQLQKVKRDSSIFSKYSQGLELTSKPTWDIITPSDYYDCLDPYSISNSEKKTPLISISASKPRISRHNRPINQCNKNVLSILKDKDEQISFRKILKYSNVLKSDKHIEVGEKERSKPISFKMTDRRLETS